MLFSQLQWDIGIDNRKCVQFMGIEEFSKLRVALFWRLHTFFLIAFAFYPDYKYNMLILEWKKKQPEK